MNKYLWKHGKWQSRLATILTVFALIATTVVGPSFTSMASTASSKIPYTISLSGSQSNSSASEINHADSMKDGAILHAWCWSFNTIKNNMASIAKAGYTSIQTSPVNACVVGNGGDLKFKEQWYYHYQPTDYTIGNYQLGSESEFAAMCAEAEKYGIKIIVDIVANHCTSTWGLISNNIKNMSNPFHTNKEISNWNDRYQVTQLALLGLYDNNTHNKNLQNYIKNYMNRCLALGADGFRYDAAKHIELPDDSGYGSDFWPTILNNGAEFQYGEILQDSCSRESAYAKYMNVTASSYGKNMRDAIGDNNFSTSRIMDYAINVSSDKLVTWVESHDNYANAITDWGSSEWMNDEQIKLTWAAIAARKGGTPLFFSRPVGGGGQNWDNRFPERTKMGDRGSSLYMDDEVAAVNKFRNAMVGQSEYLRNPNGSSKVLMIERGTKGAVIVNLNYNDTYLSSTTNLANGSYQNHTDNNNVFTVSNGNITGTLPARSVVVIYQSPSNDPVVSIKNCPTEFSEDSITLTLECKNATKATYSVNGSTSYLYSNNDTITIGAGDKVNTTYRIELRGINDSGATTSQVYTITKKDKTQESKVYFSKPSDWNNTIYAYVYDESGSSVVMNASWPGVAMTRESNGEYSYVLKSNVTAASKVIFNDGTRQTSKYGFAVTKNGHYDSNGLIGGVTENKITIYYKSSWYNTYIHYKVGNGAWTTAPGVKMSSSDKSGYQSITISLGNENTLTACFNNGSGTWDNNYSKDYYFGSAGTYTVQNNTITKQ